MRKEWRLQRHQAPIWRLVVVVLLCGGLLFAFPTSAKAVSAVSYVVMDANTGEVLLQQDAGTRRPMASTTKIMTTLLALDHPLDTPFMADAISVTVEGSSMGLLPGDEVTLRDLCYGMMLPSGNDAAGLTATHIAGSIENFAVLMNHKAADLGMVNTNFKNPSGLPDEEHYSTAYDMALLASAAIQNPAFVEISTTTSVELTFGNPPYPRTLTSHNQLLETFEGCLGLKTGYTDAAGRCFVSAATQNGRTLVCVTLNGADLWSDHTTLLNQGFAVQPDVVWDAETAVEMAVTGGVSQTFLAYTKESVTSYETAVTKILSRNFYYAPIAVGDEVGSVVIETSHGIQELPLYAGEAVDILPAKAPEGLWGQIEAWVEELMFTLSISW